MNTIKYLIATVTFCLTFCLAASASNGDLHFDKTTATIITQAGKEIPFSVEVANTDAKRRHGLMFREHLPEDSGMVFIFSPPRIVSMWMKNTPISLDIIYVNKDNTIAFIQKNTTPNNTSTISFPHPVAKVIEVNAGITEKLGIAIGDKLVYSFSD